MEGVRATNPFLVGVNDRIEAPLNSLVGQAIFRVGQAICPCRLVTIRTMSTQSVYPPSEEFVRKAHVKGMEGYLDLYRRAEQNPEEFWADVA